VTKTLASGTHARQAYQKKVLPSFDINQFHDEASLANGFCDGGAVSIAIAANSNLQHYMGGIFDASACPASHQILGIGPILPVRVNHAVLYSGVDRTFDSGNPVHVVLNSWGSNWGVSAGRPFQHVSGGQNGHVIFKFGENVCNMLALATQPKKIEVM
jgi:C1A family cysteine protease